MLAAFESVDRCILLLVAEHTHAENPYRLIYDALGISEPDEPRTKPACCGPEGQPPVDADLAARLEERLAELARALPASARRRSRRAAKASAWPLLCLVVVSLVRKLI